MFQQKGDANLEFLIGWPIQVHKSVVAVLVFEEQLSDTVRYRAIYTVGARAIPSLCRMGRCRLRIRCPPRYPSRLSKHIVADVHPH
jgi:hypothetical protein